MLVRLLTATFVACATSSPVFADSTDSVAKDSIIHELTCRDTPNGLPLAAYFAKGSFIKLKKNVGGDSESCWQFSKIYELDGLAIQGLCVATEDELTRALWPDVFYRAPGTSPGTLISVATSASLEVAKTWAVAHGIRSDAVEKSEWFAGMTKIECNSSSR